MYSFCSVHVVMCVKFILPKKCNGSNTKTIMKKKAMTQEI